MIYILMCKWMMSAKPMILAFFSPLNLSLLTGKLAKTSF